MCIRQGKDMQSCPYLQKLFKKKSKKNPKKICSIQISYLSLPRGKKVTAPATKSAQSGMVFDTSIHGRTAMQNFLLKNIKKFAQKKNRK